MEDSLSNSFYYFFSATPQVLGGILALFGVFVIFKLQTLTTEIISSASEIVKYIEDNLHKNLTNKERKNRDEVLSTIATYIRSKNVTKLMYALDLIKNERITKDDYYKFLKENFEFLYVIHKNIKDQTIQSSIFTAITIILCLGIIPFGKWFLNHPVFLGIVFGIVIICICISFYNLISVLIKSFK